LGGRSGFEQAWNCFEGLYVHRPTRLLGDLYYKYNIYDLALIEYLRLLGQGQTTPETSYRLGKIYWNMHNFTDAEKHLKKALKAGYNNPIVHWEVARLYQEMAIKTLEEGMSAYPDNNEMSELMQNLKDNLIHV